MPFRYPLLLACLLLTAAQPVAAQPAVDFDRDVQPILAEHCWRCHSEKRAAGGLRLDEKILAERGGGSGKNALSLGVMTNELLRRVRSTDETERMPPEGPLLTAHQINTLERWIAQGAPWPEPPPEQTVIQSSESLFDLWLDRWEYAASSRYQPAYFLCMLILLGMIFIERAKDAARKGLQPASSAWMQAIQRQMVSLSRAWYLVGFLGVAVFIAVQYAGEQANELTRQKGLQKQLRPLPMATGQGLHDPYRPTHPPRLGGAYYRGNDERSEELFNGGFYRTATFHVHLADAQGHNLAWGDAMPERPHIRFQIVRAPHSSPSLFTPEIMQNVGLSATQPEQLQPGKATPLIRLETDIPGESWSVLFPLEPLPSQGKLAGKVYLYKANSSANVLGREEAAYLIGYELSAREGKIARQSQLWMASVYNVASLQWPEPGKIPADHWFDFRPIPEIEQE